METGDKEEVYEAHFRYKDVDILSFWCLVKPNPVNKCQAIFVRLWKLGKQGQTVKHLKKRQKTMTNHENLWYGFIDGHPELKIKHLKQDCGEVESADGSPLDFSEYHTFTTGPAAPKTEQ